MEPKKNKAYDLERNYRLHLAVGLILSLSFTLVAFEWRTKVEPVVDLLAVVNEFDEVLPPVPPTVQEPPKPKLVPPVVLEVPDDQEIEDDIDFIIDVEISEDDAIADMVITEPEAEETDEPVIFAEKQPEFPGGISAFYAYVAQNVNYPKPAIRQGVSGKVFVQFVIDRDGSLSGLEVVKGIGAGCDEEALRVVRNSPLWNPGKQRGKPVRVRMVVPISFQLQ